MNSICGIAAATRAVFEEIAHVPSFPFLFMGKGIFLEMT
jgi:hypothetical protein